MRLKIMLFGVFFLASIPFLIADLEGEAIPPENQPAEAADPFELNRAMRKGVNLGNALEAPVEGQWGMVIHEEYLERIRKAGFDAVRIPIRWNAHARESSPYTVDPAFFKRVDEVIGWAKDRGLAVMINLHHYNELTENPERHHKRFLSIWEQIARHYQHYPNSLLFEVLNEPHGNLGPDLWNEYLKDAIEIIRATNPHRTVVIGTAPWGGFGGLRHLRVPEEDRNIIVTVHYYNPFQFTHQGAAWVGERSKEWIGTTWNGTEKEKAEVDADFDGVLEWARQNNRPIHLGEFGAYRPAPLDSRVRWTEYVRESAERRDFSWAYWEFGAGFGIYDRDAGQWRKELLRALIPESGEL